MPIRHQKNQFAAQYYIPELTSTNIQTEYSYLLIISLFYKLILVMMAKKEILKNKTLFLHKF